MKKRILVIGIIMLMTLPSLSAADLYISNSKDLKIGNSIAEQTGNIYYVDQNHPHTSDSNTGTEDLPWKTIQKAAETIMAGDTVYVKEGTYNERIIPQNSGAPGNYITYASFPGDSVTIDGTGYQIWYDQGLFHIEKSYIKISGLRVINSEWAGIATIYTDHSIIENCITYNTDSSGILAAYASNIIIDGNEVEKANTGPVDEAITVGRVENFEIKNNHVHHCTRKEGIDVKSGCSNGKIYKNHVHDIAGVGIYVDAGSYDEHNIDVFQNNVHDCLHGIILESENGGNLENINVYNNIVYDNIYNGIDIGGMTGKEGYERNNIKVINNILHNNGALAIKIMTQTEDVVGPLIIRNNILSGNNWQMLYFRYAGTYASSNVYVDHNLFTADSDYYGDNTVIGDPMFVNPSEADFHLLEDSPAIDSGSPIDAPDFDFDGNKRPSGNRYDIGVFEYQGDEDLFSDDFNDDVFGFFLKYTTGNLKKELEAKSGRIKVEYLRYDWSLNEK